MTTDLYIGKRISYDSRLCTVRYIGQVKGTKGEWLGVEWDDPTRGKHAGEHDGVRYFDCASPSKTAGSFIRPTRKTDPPRSFVEALKAKYASEHFEDPDVEIVFNVKPHLQTFLARQNRPIRISGKEVEEIGFDKIRKQLADLKELRIVILDGLCMSRPIANLRERQKSGARGDEWPSDLTDITEVCPKIVELDLSRNLFEEWREVASICEQLDKLKSLRVDGNRFRDTSVTDCEKERCLKSFGHIKTLRLEDNLLSWEKLANITNLFPQLTTFFASSNNYRSLTSHFLPHAITNLSFEDNLFHSIADVAPLTKLPNLQRLVLKSNEIHEINPYNSSHLVFSPTLTDVDFSFNEISTWPFIDELEHVFPGLTSLRVSHNPLYNSLQAADGRALTAEDGYMLTLARLGNLKTLNYSPITEKERLNAESYYLSLIARELTFSPERLQEQIIASHPRYAWLCSEYGEPHIQRSANAVNPNSLAARLIKFTFYLTDSTKVILSQSAVGTPKDKFEAEIPMSFSVYSLLGIVGKSFGIPPMKCKLIWETGDWMPVARSGEAIQDWDYDSDDEDETGATGVERVMREDEIVPGTRLIGTWIDGMEAIVRVEIRQ
ncbi:hypothetical protein P154DRAFT_520600 [Amniculicola lignicola CBS 123094]|uniref:CAP-Gly domain-containing protein n=1 Tax=Amniculicola lignicola CBS 123094 TaxID=1392246 RepID=A0A6A5WRL8_9PLEO|nr:hypothetical protein P154DRAFT_520600 [Amniculicola lignicola CBS 123094]